jgi:predicted transcriptional regulator
MNNGNISQIAVGNYISQKINQHEICNDFKEALTLIGKSSLLDAQTRETLDVLLSIAKESIEKHDIKQKEFVKERFKCFLDSLGEKAKTVLSILAECATVLDFFGIKIS